MTIDWTAPLYVAGTNRPVLASHDEDADGERWCHADWDGDGIVYDKLISKDGYSTTRRYQITNTPAAPIWPKLDDETKLRIAREAASLALEALGKNKAAFETRSGSHDNNAIFGAAFVALTHGPELLQDAEPPEVVEARRVIAEYEKGKE